MAKPKRIRSASRVLNWPNPWHIRQVDINPQIVFSYIKSKGNLSLNNGYEESNTGDNQVVYNGNLVFLR